MQSSWIKNCDLKVVGFVNKLFSSKFSECHCIAVKKAKAVRKFELVSFDHCASQI